MTKLKYLKEIIPEIEKLLQELGGEVIPCTQEEVDLLEKMLPSPYHLPAAYKEFLLYGGNKMAQMFKGGFSFSFKEVKFWLENRTDIAKNLGSKLPSDVLVLAEHLGGYFEYLRLTEGDDPPVYFWQEGDLDGLEVAKKRNDSFSDYLIQAICDYHYNQISKTRKKKLKAGQPRVVPPFLYPTSFERVHGTNLVSLMHRAGFSYLGEVKEAAEKRGLDSYAYLEEVSGWKRHRLLKDGIPYIRFFPSEIAPFFQEDNQYNCESNVPAIAQPQNLKQGDISVEIEQVIALCKRHIEEFNEEVIGCSVEEVEALQSILPSSYHLPAAYKAFLFYGGKKMAGLFEQLDFSYNVAVSLLKNGYQDLLKPASARALEDQTLQDLFVISQSGNSFYYLRLTQGDDPPVYAWSRKAWEGLESAELQSNSFSEFIIKQLRQYRYSSINKLISEKLKISQPPRGRQFWLFTSTEQAQGIRSQLLSRNLGFSSMLELAEAADFHKIDCDTYLEELSSWQARQVDGETRFFPPKA